MHDSSTVMRGFIDRRSIFLPAALALAALFVTPASTFADNQSVQQDPTLAAMQAELTREQAGLVLPGMQKPYFLQYRLDDVSTYEAVANFGALTRETAAHQRIVRVSVRIGAYQSDNSSARGEGALALAPTTDDDAADAQALRYALWLATDEAYKAALRELSAKQAALKQFQTESAVPDFAEAKPIEHLDPLAALTIDRDAWKKTLAEASGLYQSQPFANHVQYSTANLRASAMNRYLVNSEGAAVRTASAQYAAYISVGGQADDGMQLGRNNGTTATTAAGLESPAAFRQRALDDLNSFNQLRTAPVVSADDFHGPVLFSADAATDVLNRLFVPNLEADRPDLGTTARTQGAYTSSLHARVLPAILSVTDNPLERTFAGQQLVGSYTVDDEGVPATATDVVVDGKLQTFLIGREPVRDLPRSNGHGRAPIAQPPHSRAGVLTFQPVSPFVTGATPPANPHPLSDTDMQAHLLALAREQNRDVYQVETMSGEAPRLLFLVHPDGSRTLVRGAVFDELDTRALRSSIAAAGGTPFVNNTLGPIPQTTIAPALLFDDIGVKRAAEEQQKLPFYPPPPTTP